MIVVSGIWHWILIHTGTLNEPGPYYGFFSGFGSDLGEIAIIGGLIQMARHHNCHVKGCLRLGHIDPINHHPACKKHHSYSDRIGTAVSNSITGNIES